MDGNYGSGRKLDVTAAALLFLLLALTIWYLVTILTTPLLVSPRGA